MKKKKLGFSMAEHAEIRAELDEVCRRIEAFRRKIASRSTATKFCQPLHKASTHALDVRGRSWSYGWKSEASTAGRRVFR